MGRLSCSVAWHGDGDGSFSMDCRCEWQPRKQDSAAAIRQRQPDADTAGRGHYAAGKAAVSRSLGGKVM
ncbi:hypothetical protein ACSS6W_001076 [Trichoderma asperelloides]